MCTAALIQNHHSAWAIQRRPKYLTLHFMVDLKSLFSYSFRIRNTCFSVWCSMPAKAMNIIFPLQFTMHWIWRKFCFEFFFQCTYVNSIILLKVYHLKRRRRYWKKPMFFLLILYVLLFHCPFSHHSTLLLYCKYEYD